MEITSRNNEKVKSFVKLRDSARNRRAERLFILEGARLCSDALRSGYKIVDFFYTETSALKYADKVDDLLHNSENKYEISDIIAQKLSDTVNPQGIFCTARFGGEKDAEIVSGGRYIALDNIQNPDNLGAVSRTAEALGIDGIISSGGCDIYNPKALRASMGSLLRIKIIETDDLAEFLSGDTFKNIPSFAAVPDADAENIKDVDFSSGAVVIIGNEGNGISEKVKNSAKRKITIPMAGNAESLNASAAAVITMWEMMK